MPGRDGTGPAGGGSGGGKGKGQGGGRMGGFKLGPGGDCVCPECGKKAAHQRGVPCTRTVCPSCGTPMTRT